MFSCLLVASVTMELSYFINLIFIFVLNVLFFVSGVCLNSLVILSFWRSTQFRKKLCYFMIIVLSCCDLLAVLTNNSLVALITMLWLTGMLDACIPQLGSYSLKNVIFFPNYFYSRSFCHEFWSIFGDILSYLSSNIGNEGKTTNSFCNTKHSRITFRTAICNCYFSPSA